MIVNFFYKVIIMNDKICFADNSFCVSRNHFVVIIFIFSLFTIYHFYIIKNKKKIIKKPEKKFELPLDTLLKIRDQNVIDNPAHPPERRLPIDIYPKKDVKRLLNIPTRGYPDKYQMLGILSRTSDEKILHLYGRQKYPGANTWEYYVVGKDASGLENKIPIKTQNDKEIYDNDSINIPQLDSSKGSFSFTQYDLDAPRYNPYVI